MEVTNNTILEDQYNLIYNGKMLHGMDGYAKRYTNQTYDMDTTDKPAGCAASYLVLNSNSTAGIMDITQGFFPLMPYLKNDTYKLHFQIKVNSSYDKVSNYYFSVKSYDNKGYYIPIYEVCAVSPNGNSTITTLSQDLNNGDTIVHLTDASKWVANQTYQWLGIIESAAYGDDRMLCGQKIVKDSVDTTNNTVTLQSGWSQGTYKAGSKVREFTDSAVCYYPQTWTSSTIPDSWTTYDISFNAAQGLTYISGTIYSMNNYVNALRQGYFIGLGMLQAPRVKMADFSLENLSRLQPRIPNMQFINKNDTYNTAFDDYSESTSSVNQYGQLNTGMLSEGFLPVRYIRDHVNGFVKNGSEFGYNHWVEIQAFDRWNRNVAFAADGSWAGTIYNGINYNGSRAGLNVENTTSYKPLHVITDNDTDPNWHLDGDTTIKSVTIDMGIIHYIDKIKVWHYYADGRTYHSTKTEVSVDGDNWIIVFNSAVEGEYAESSEGHTITFDKLGTLYHTSMRKGGETLVQDIIED